MTSWRVLTILALFSDDVVASSTPACKQRPTNRNCVGNVCEWESRETRKMGVAFDAFDVVAVPNYRPVPHDFWSDCVPLVEYMIEWIYE